MTFVRRWLAIVTLLPGVLGLLAFGAVADGYCYDEPSAAVSTPTAADDTSTGNSGGRHD